VKSPRRLCVLVLFSLCTYCCLSICAWAAVSNGGAADGTATPQQQADMHLPSAEAGIPGPLPPFLRMAGISQKISPEDVLPLLGRNVFAQGYAVGNRPTEFLVLLSRYLQQARELVRLAGDDGVLRATNCMDAEPLLRVLGYRARQGCGQPSASLETADAKRAFVTIDSGFPLPELERTLQGGKPFAYRFPVTRVPVLFSEHDWMSVGSRRGQHGDKDLTDALINDPSIARLYWALSRLDPETRNTLQRSLGLWKLAPFAAVLDFYGPQICIRSGRVIVPGGAGSEAAWKDLVGANPDAPAAFVQKLLSKDKGWLAAYFDVLSRVGRTQQTYFVESQRLHRFYDGLRSPDITTSATKGAFRPAPGMLVLATRLQWGADHEPLVPGSIEVWREILRQKADSSVRDAARHASHVTDPEDLVRTMFSLSRAPTESGPLRIYLTLSEIDARRSPNQRLSPETVRLMARKFDNFSSQYMIFSEFPKLSDSSITLFLDVAASLDAVPNSSVRGNALGAFQANVGIWQILARQGQIPAAQQDGSFQRVIAPFAKIRSAAQVYDAGCASLTETLLAATGKSRASQNEIIELLAGPPQSNQEATKMHEELANAMRSVLDSQRLVSLDTLLALGDGLKQKEEGKPVGDWMVTLAGELREFEMPRPIFTNGERTEWASGIYNNNHTDVQMRTDLTKVIKQSASHAQLEEARGQLASFLRDALVGLNYAYYDPPGSQALHHNPLLVRSHDFSAETVGGINEVWQTPQLFGQGSPAGGGAHLVGSLADLPYALAEMEQDFIAPENIQALIWRELVPGLLTSAILPRWWNVSDNELHAIALYQRMGEELLTASATNEELQKDVLGILSDRLNPRRLGQVEQALRAGRVQGILTRIMPADSFYLAAEFRRRYPGSAGTSGPAALELESLCRQHPDEVNWERLSQDFGTPHPALAQTYARELLNVPPLPAFAGHSSRLLAESWDSSNLYWARLADEAGYPPVVLNRLVPELTRRMVAKVFATEFEDWPAVVRALQETGDSFRQEKKAATRTVTGTSQASASSTVGNGTEQ